MNANNVKRCPRCQRHISASRSSGLCASCTSKEMRAAPAICRWRTCAARGFPSLRGYCSRIHLLAGEGE